MMYAAYFQFSGPMKDKKIDPNKPSMFMGKDSEALVEEASKYGEDPYFVGGMFEMSRHWDKIEFGSKL
jgi:hypothetical protein